MLSVSDFKTKKENSSFNLIGKIRVKILVAVAVTTIALIFVQLIFANNLATDGHKLSSVNDEIARLERENTTLKVQIAEASALTSLSEKTQELGFEKPTKVIIP